MVNITPVTDSHPLTFVHFLYFIRGEIPTLGAKFKKKDVFFSFPLN